MERVLPEDLSYGFDLTGLDPASLGDAVRAVFADAMADPVRMMTWLATLSISQQSAGLNLLKRLAGQSSDAVLEPAAGDKRFADAAWKDNPWLASMLEAYLVQTRAVLQLIESSRLPEATRRKARFAMSMFNDAFSPSNVPWLNPAVVKEAMNTGGDSLIRGMMNYADDIRNNRGMPRQVDTSAFKLGVNLAATPGRVVYRNDVMELIAYEPQTPTVHAIPLLCSPPWINKYYIMDLAPGRSFVEWAVRHGHQTFMMSYRNPDASMASYVMDDYLRKGLLDALDAVERVTGAKQTNLAALCLGGTMAYVLMAYLAARGQSHRIASATLTNSLIDFGEPGDLGVFTDEVTIARLEKKMNERGYLESGEMAGTFDWMRANDLIWSYVVNNWFMGKQPPAFDILAWNGDSTRMPAAMHSQYLRACYLHNLIATPNAFVIDGTPIDLRRVHTPLYVLGAEADHIAPWRSTYQGVRLVSGDDVRYTLTNAGHVAGIVNPPGNGKSCHWAAERVDRSHSADQWRESAACRKGSWWEDWAVWAREHAGPMVTPCDLPSGEAAPGPYVKNETAAPLDLKRARSRKKGRKNEKR